MTKLGRHRTALAGLGLGGLACLWLSELALFVAFLTLLTWLCLPPLPAQQRRRWHLALFAIAALATLGLARFIREHALEGMLTAGREDLDKDNVSRLREILFAEDQARERGLLDHDRDGIGSALFLSELSGARPLRQQSGPSVRLLDRRYTRVEPTKVGPATVINGYLFVVCLPTQTGLSAMPAEGVDEELAERRFVAYAWPLDASISNAKVFAIDEHERILESQNRGPRGSVYVGTERPPPCDAFMQKDAAFSPWKGKQPRQRLPGDRRAAE